MNSESMSLEGNENDGPAASLIPSAYIYHNSTSSLVTPMVQNVPVELDVGAVFTGNLFTNAGDGRITSISKRPFRADIHFDPSIQLQASGGVASINQTIRKNNVTVNAGEMSIIAAVDNRARGIGISREIDFSEGDFAAVWVENTSDNFDLILLSLTGIIKFIGWL